MAFTKNTFTIRWFNTGVKEIIRHVKEMGRALSMCECAHVPSSVLLFVIYGTHTNNQALCKMLETE